MADRSPRDVLLQVESLVSAAVFSTSPRGGEAHQAGHVGVATAAEALLGAAAAAREGKRAAVFLSPRELLEAVGALHAVAMARAPIVVHVVSSGETPKPPPGAVSLGEGNDGDAQDPGRDEIACALDAGAAVLVTWSAQESVDLALAARRAAEDAETPFVLVADGGGAVMSMPGPGLVEKFLPIPPAAHAPSTSAVDESTAKRRERSFGARAPFALAGAMRALGELTGRPLAPIERFETADADEIVVAVGEAFPAARAAAVALRREGRRVGVLGVRVLRPFFAADLVKAIGRARAVAVVEPLDIALAPAGPVATSLKAAFADAITWAPGFPGVGHIPMIVSVSFATVAGAVTEAEVRAALAELAMGDHAKRVLVLGSDPAS